MSKLKDVNGDPIRDLDRYIEEWSESFEFNFIEEGELTHAERGIWSRLDDVFAVIGGRPRRRRGPGRRWSCSRRSATATGRPRQPR